jgi:hypothetical protein
MRRTIFMALLAAVLVALVPSAAHAQSTTEILRDCADDDVLQGDYSVSAMRKARNDIPAELDEYSACRDVLSRAIAAKTAATKDNNPSGNSGGTGGGGGGTGGSGDGGFTPPTTSAPPASTPSGRDPGIQVGPSTTEDWNAVHTAASQPTEAVKVNGRPVTPAASVGRNGLPGTLVAALVLLVAAALAMTVPFVRRRVVTRPSPT